MSARKRKARGKPWRGNYIVSLNRIKHSHGCYRVRVVGTKGIVCPNLSQARALRKLIIAAFRAGVSNLV